MGDAVSFVGAAFSEYVVAQVCVCVRYMYVCVSQVCIWVCV